MSRFWTPVTLVIALAGLLRATSLIPMTFDNQVEDAAEIFLARVDGIDSEWRESERGRVIFSTVTFAVLERYKGADKDVVKLEFLGGTIGDEKMVVEGIPTFRVGEEAVLFVSGDRTRACPVVGWSRGKLDVERDANGRGVVRLSSQGQIAVNAARTRQILRSDDRMALGEFGDLVKRRVLESKAAR